MSLKPLLVLSALVWPCLTQAQDTSQQANDWEAVIGTSTPSLPASDQTGFGLGLGQDGVSSSGELEILSCPWEIFRDAYLSAVTPAQKFAVMALEDEALGACIRRAQEVKRVLELDAQLAELFAAAEARDEGAGEAGAGIRSLEPTADTLAASVQAAPTVGDESVSDAVSPQPAPAPQYFIEMAGIQNRGDEDYSWARLSDDSGEQFTAQAGHLLPGGVRILEVTRKTVRARLADGAEVELPLAPREKGGQVINMNFDYQYCPPGDVCEWMVESE